MLRETKLGLVVSCGEFLGLLGAVVTSKLREKDAPTDKARPPEPEIQTATTAPPAIKHDDPPTVSLPGAPKKRHPSAPGFLPDEVKQAGLQETDPAKSKEPATPPSAPPGLPTSEPPAPEKKGGEESETPMVGGTKIITPPPSPEQPLALDPRKEQTKKEKSRPKTEPSDQPIKKEGASGIAPPVAVAEGVKTEPEATAPTGLPMVTPILPEEGKKDTPAPLPEVVPSKDKEDKKEKTTDPGHGLPTPTPPEPLSTPPEVTPMPAPMPAPVTTPTPLPPEGPPTGLPSPVPEGGPEKKKEPIVIPRPEVVGVKAPETAAPPMGGTPALPVVPAPGPETKIVPGSVAAPMPPVVARTPTPPAAGGGPVKVESVNEEDYTVKQGDSFASISKEKYKAEGYADALRRYNQDDTLRNVPLEEKDGFLKPGQKVTIPDLGILEKRYSNVLPKMSALPKKEETPPPVVEARLTPVPTVPDSGIRTVAASSGVSYRVPANGQTMREIARITLGDGERWNQILSLNPNFRPDYVVPVGSVLILPPDAKVPAESQP